MPSAFITTVPCEGVEIKVADNGEILIKSPGLLKEYYKNPAATAEVLTYLAHLAIALGDRLCDGPTPKGSDQVRFSSIRGFKGLEAAVVVLCELEDLDPDSRDQQLYVGLSRARNHAVIVAPEA